MRWFVVSAAILLAACASGGVVPESPAGSRTLDRDSYRLGVGDRIKIEVFGEPDLSIEAPVESGGTINYPLLGRVPAIGVTVTELEGRVAGQLAQGYLVNPRVRIFVAQYRPIYIVGQVKSAGSYPYVLGLTVEKAVALAGGLTPIASERKIHILREAAGGRERAKLETPVLPGDTIIVEESLF